MAVCYGAQADEADWCSEALPVAYSPDPSFLADEKPMERVRGLDVLPGTRRAIS